MSEIKSFKKAVVSTVDVVVFLPFLVVAVFVVGGLMSGQTLYALGFGAVGWLLCCILSGTWYVLSSINSTLQEINKKIESQ